MCIQWISNIRDNNWFIWLFKILPPTTQSLMSFCSFCYAIFNLPLTIDPIVS